MPDQTMPTHVVREMIRPGLGYRLWFAYGPCMDPDIAAQRIPDPVFVTTASIPSRKFLINADGVASIAPRRNHTVHGIVWMVDEVALAGLDIQLVVPHDYDRYGCLGRDPHKRPILMEYHAPRNPRPVRPGHASLGYLGPIVAAGIRWRFPQSYLDGILRWGPAHG